MASTFKVRNDGLDKFYTKPDIALKCISKIKNWDNWDLVIEPSAGNGSFYNNIPVSNKIEFLDQLLS